MPLATTLSSCVPVLRVADARRSCDFYCGALGFRKLWEHQREAGLPLLVSVERGGARLFLTEHPETETGALVYLYASDVDALAHELRERGVAIDDGPADRPWGMREMHVRDPDGNQLRFGRSTDRV